MAKSLASSKSKKTLNNQKSKGMSLGNGTKKGKNAAAARGKAGNLKGSFGAAKQNLASNHHSRQTLRSANNQQSAKVSRKSNLNTVQNNSHSQRRNQTIRNKVKKTPLSVPKRNTFVSHSKDSKMKAPASAFGNVSAVTNTKALAKNAKSTKAHPGFSKPAQSKD